MKLEKKVIKTEYVLTLDKDEMDTLLLLTQIYDYRLLPNKPKQIYVERIHHMYSFLKDRIGGEGE